MTDHDIEPATLPLPGDPADGYRQGFSSGLATGALALSVVAFVNLLGLEKSILAAFLAVLALRGGARSRIASRRGRLALAIAALHPVVFVTILALFHDKLAQLIGLLQQLG